MTTVTYRNQPGTASVLKQGTPLAGTAHVYTVKKVLWPEQVESFIGTLMGHDSLHICCSMSQLGKVRLDLDPATKPNVVADASKLPFRDEQFDTVLCDPPYNGKFQWNHDVLNEMVRVARRRVIFQHWFMPIDSKGRFKKWTDRWVLSACYVWQPRTYFGRVQVISVLDAM
jgi:Methyltransferase domain